MIMDDLVFDKCYIWYFYIFMILLLLVYFVEWVEGCELVFVLGECLIEGMFFWWVVIYGYNYL